MSEQLSQVLESLKGLLTYDPASPMIFSSGLFLFMFCGFTLIYGFMRRRPTLRIVYVLLFSLYFYYLSSGLYFMLILVVATVDYFIGLRMSKEQRVPVRKLLMFLSVAVNLGMLCYFKYTNFFIGLFNDVAGH